MATKQTQLYRVKTVEELLADGWKVTGNTLAKTGVNHKFDLGDSDAYSPGCELDDPEVSDDGKEVSGVPLSALSIREDFVGNLKFSDLCPNVTFLKNGTIEVGGEGVITRAESKRVYDLLLQVHGPDAPRARAPRRRKKK